MNGRKELETLIRESVANEPEVIIISTKSSDKHDDK